MRLGVLVLLVFILAISLAAPALAQTQLRCGINLSACDAGYGQVLRISSVTNAHGEQATGSGNYNNLVCCGPGPLNIAPLSTCDIAGNTQAVAFNLSSATNAHAEETGQPNYNFGVCLSVTSGGLGADCQVINKVAGPSLPDDDCANAPGLGPSYGCVATLSGTTNAHIASCSAGASVYSRVVCCSANVDNQPPIMAYDSGQQGVNTPPTGQSTKGLSGDFVQWAMIVGNSTTEDLAECRVQITGSSGADYTTPVNFTMVIDHTNRGCSYNVTGPLGVNDPLEDGTYTHQLFGRDAAGNWGTLPHWTFKVTTDFPVSSFVQPLDNQNFSNSTAWGPAGALITGTSTDLKGGIKTVHLRGVAANLPLPNCLAPFGPQHWSFGGPCPDWIEIYNDAACTPAPTGTCQPVVSWQFNFPVNGPATPHLHYFGEGNFTFIVNATDYFGNEELIPVTVDVTFDRRQPRVLMNPGNPAPAQRPQIAGSTSQAAGIFDQPGELPPPLVGRFPVTPSGAAKLEAEIWDTNSNTQIDGGWSNVQTTPTRYGSVTIGPNWPTKQSLVLGDQVTSFSFEVLGLPSGNYNISLRATDAAGNLQTDSIDSRDFVVDLSAPDIIFTSPVPPGPLNKVDWIASGDGNPIRGRAVDDGTVVSVIVSIKNITHGVDGLYWNQGTGAWQATEVYNPAAISGSGTTIDWEFPTTNPPPYIPQDPTVTGPIGEDRSMKVRITVNSTDNTNKGAPEFIEIIYDNEEPNAWMNTLPPFVLTPFVNITWNATDYMTAPENIHFTVYYAEYDGISLIRPPSIWKTFLGPGRINFAENIVDGHRYEFYVIARDEAGNTVTSATVSTTIDLTPPTCAILPVAPPYVTVPFNVNTTPSGGGSPISAITIQNRQCGDGSSPCDSWTNVWDRLYCSPIALGENGTVCSGGGVQEGWHQFRCKVNDTAGNEGAWSENITIIVDTEPPDVQTITSPSSGWTNSIPFDVEWDVRDNDGDAPYISGLGCVNITWRNTLVPGDFTSFANTPGGTPADWCQPPTVTKRPFGDNQYSTPNAANGQSYEFRVRGIDNVNLSGIWSSIVSVGIDLNASMINMTSSNYDTGAPVSNTTDVISPNINFPKLAMTSQAYDHAPAGPGLSVSGIKDHVIFAEITREGIFQWSHHCGTDPQCTFQDDAGNPYLDITGSEQVVFFAQVTDNAGNINKTPEFILAKHPLANFVTHDISLPIGTSYDAEVQVRNLGDAKIDVTLTLEGYTLAGFTFGEGDWSSLAIPAASNGRIAAITELEPRGRGIVHVEVFSTDPSLGAQELRLRAAASNGLTDSDNLTVALGFPTSFSALDDVYALLLVIFAIGLFVLVFEKRLTKL